MNQNEWFRARKAEMDKARAQRLEIAKKEATSAGKEPFDLGVMDALWRDNPDRRSEALGHIIPEESRTADWSEVYYVQYPEITTMADFVAKMKEVQVQGFFD